MSAPNLQMVELTARVADADVAAVWSLASFDPNNLDHRRRVMEFYPPNGSRRMFGLMEGSSMISTCGVTQHPNGRITIHQVATIPTHRRRGFGKQLLKKVCEELDPRTVECGTDAPSAEFYRACGFTLESEGIPPSGIERFHCKLSR